MGTFELISRNGAAENGAKIAAPLSWLAPPPKGAEFKKSTEKLTGGGRGGGEGRIGDWSNIDDYSLCGLTRKFVFGNALHMTRINLRDKKS